jgi:hypothetical protein
MLINCPNEAGGPSEASLSLLVSPTGMVWKTERLDRLLSPSADEPPPDGPCKLRCSRQFNGRDYGRPDPLQCLLNCVRIYVKTRRAVKVGSGTSRIPSIAAMSASLSSKSKMPMFSVISSARTDFGMTESQ